MDFFVLLLMAIPHQDVDLHENFYIDISVVLECLFIKQETVEIKNKNKATQSN